MIGDEVKTALRCTTENEERVKLMKFLGEEWEYVEGEPNPDTP